MRIALTQIFRTLVSLRIARSNNSQRLSIWGSRDTPLPMRLSGGYKRSSSRAFAGNLVSRASEFQEFRTFGGPGFWKLRTFELLEIVDVRSSRLFAPWGGCDWSSLILLSWGRSFWRAARLGPARVFLGRMLGICQLPETGLARCAVPAGAQHADFPES